MVCRLTVMSLDLNDFLLCIIIFPRVRSRLADVSTSRSAETPARSLFRADIPATHSFRAVRTQERHIRLSHIVSVSQEEYRDEHPLAVDHTTKSSGSYRQSPYFH